MEKKSPTVFPLEKLRRLVETQSQTPPKRERVSATLELVGSQQAEEPPGLATGEDCFTLLETHALLCDTMGHVGVLNSFLTAL